MTLTVQEKAEYMGTFRWIEVFLMETLAGWVPTTAEMEIKVLFGRHVWEAAQNADGLGKRAFELRAPLHYTLKPRPEMAAFLAALREAEKTGDRLYAYYDVVIPAMVERYQAYLDSTDPLLDEPSVRILERILDGYARQRRERPQYCAEFPTPMEHDPKIERAWDERRAAAGDFVEHGVEGTLARAC
jgi:hypothetical protein